MDKLSNWPQVLFNFRKMLSNAKKTVPFSSRPQDRSATCRLLRLIVRNSNTKRYTSIEANFLFAAMHLACMRDLRLSKDACPDLPENFSSFVHS